MRWADTQSDAGRIEVTTELGSGIFEGGNTGSPFRGKTCRMGELPGEKPSWRLRRFFPERC
ncbi:hypothetical protein [Pasteuria penetrans]|uniref:hypothetical protein n=1 Tax=Pasteuria penetrans TaxID=86005 RepID=UPI0011EBBEF8|nr:hypothetical protein [Pasteuria penetrans]